MKLFVLYDKAGIHSGRVLGRYLIKHLQGKASVQRGRPKRLEVLQSKGYKYDFIINVGWFREFNTGGATVLNLPGAISHSSNKRKARKSFEEKKIPAPKLWLTPTEIGTNDYPVVGRTTHHSKGKGFWFCKNLTEAQRARSQGATHFMRFIPNTREFRVHVMARLPELGSLDVNDYLTIKLSEKIPHPRANSNDIIKNHENGWFFGYPKNRKDKSLSLVRKVARQTISEFGLHWGAVDIMVSNDTGEAFVLEINSSPCLTDDSANTLEKYAQSICSLVGLEPRKERAKSKPISDIKLETQVNRKSKRERHLKSFLQRNNLL